MYSHDYTECCRDAGVRTRCLGFCSIDNIMEGKAGQNPSACEPDFKKIVRCMADGRNHIPCCERAQGGDSKANRPLFGDFQRGPWGLALVG